jgi:[ribosomal protein S5]-alanine N-acetyltransferase
LRVRVGAAERQAVGLHGIVPLETPTFVQQKTRPPVLDLGDIRLRPLRPGDEHALCSYLQDPRVIEHTSIPVVTLESVRASVERDIAAYSAGTSCRWAISGADDRLIGICGFNSWSLVHEHAELAYDLDPQQWGHGYMRRAVRAALGWGFAAGFNRIHAFVMTTNSRSVAVLERTGFTREGTLRQFRNARGAPRDFHVYSVLRKEFAAGEDGASSDRAFQRIPPE